VINPVETIGKARRRLAIVAASQAVAYAIAPAAVLCAMAVVLPSLDGLMRNVFGYHLGPALTSDFRLGLGAAAAAALAVSAAMALREWRRCNDFVAAAERIDGVLNAHEEILTLATLADPGRADARAERTPLFPILWRRAAAYLEKLDPEKSFRFEIGAPLSRGSLAALAIIVALALAMMALVRPPTPEEAQARRLRDIAREVEKSGIGGTSLAHALDAAASALENPKLPPEEKLKVLADVMRNVERQEPRLGEPKGKGESAKGEGTGKGESGSGKGEGAGKGEGGSGNQGKGQGAGGEKNKQGAEKQLSELKDELKKAEAKVESESAPKESPMPKPEPGEKQGSASVPKEDRNKPGPLKEPSASGEQKMPKPGESPAAKEQEGKGGKNETSQKASSQGDTRLGQTPRPVRYEKFYKPGEHGPMMDLRDARYLLFRLPPAVPSGPGGKTVADTSRPEASTPYSNAPLKPEKLEASPDERQLIPPRYRELIQ
jgi:hypothetical protein